MLFKTKCYQCDKNIKINIPFKFRRYKVHGAFSCNQCVPENSPVRNGQDEAFWTELVRNKEGVYMEQLSEGAMALNNDEVFNNCSYSCYADIADALWKLKEYEDIGTVDELKKAIKQHIPKKCTACSGSGWYDSCDKHGKPIPCGACDGTGHED